MIVPISDCSITAPTPSSSFPWPTAIPAFITTVVAVIVCYIAWQQWQTAKEKLRLDLYNRRFEIYLKAFNYGSELMVWKRTAEQIEIGMQFFKAFKESAFLFNRDSGIIEFLKKMNACSDDIERWRIVQSNIKEFPAEMIEMTRAQHTDSLKWLNEVPEQLTELMMPYMGFANSR